MNLSPRPASHRVLYAAWLLVFGIHLPEKGYDTVFAFNARKLGVDKHTRFSKWSKPKQAAVYLVRPGPVGRKGREQRPSEQQRERATVRESNRARERDESLQERPRPAAITTHTQLDAPLLSKATALHLCLGPAPVAHDLLAVQMGSHDLGGSFLRCRVLPRYCVGPPVGCSFRHTFPGHA